MFGSAADVGGVVAAVEISVDGGLTWHPAGGSTTWGFHWTPRGNGVVRLLSRAVDDSGNIQEPPTQIEVVVGSRVDPGPGGPVLVLVNGLYATNPFGGYLAEMLRGEGLNAFSVREWVAVMDAPDPLATLQAYPLVILAETGLLPTQQQVIRSYVSGGGALIAMRPDPAISDLFGVLVDGSREETPGLRQFLQFTADSGPGSGLTSDSLQFHGAVDLYKVGSGSVVARLCRDLATVSDHAAVVRRGHAVAFCFDLARSIVLTRQGNPGWQDSKGDGNPSGAAYHAADLFARHEGPILDEPERLRVPQADLLQRFFANIVLELVSRPMPRLW